MKFLTKPLTFLLLILPFVSLAQTPDAVYCVDALGTETYSVTPSDPANSFSWSSDNSSIVFNSPTAQSTDVDWAVLEKVLTLIFTEESSIPGCSSSVEFIVQIEKDLKYNQQQKLMFVKIQQMKFQQQQQQELV